MKLFKLKCSICGGFNWSATVGKSDTWLECRDCDGAFTLFDLPKSQYEKSVTIDPNARFFG